MRPLTVGSVFSGVEGFGLGLETAGFEVLFQIEIDRDATSVLERHYPGVRRYRDVQDVTGAELPTVDVLVGGFPCFAAGTLVLAERGFVPIETLTVGERVLTHLGRWRPITAVMQRQALQTVVVRGQGIPDITTTPEHPFYARQRGRTYNSQRRGWDVTFSEPDWVEAGALEQSAAHIAQVLPTDACSPVPALPDGVDPSAFWWLVGRYLADGWRTVSNGKGRVVICSSYQEAATVHEIIERVVHCSVREEPTAIRFHITRKWLYDWLEPFGRGAAGKLIPGWALSLPPADARALLEGYLTGDGYRQSRNQWTATTVSRSLALGIALLAQRAFGVVASVHETTLSDWTSIAGRRVRQRTQYQLVIPDRNRSARVEGDYGWKLVRRVAESGPATVWNISVDTDESYVADGAIVHNCQDVSVAGARRGLAGARTGLFYEIARLAAECAPRWLLFENVPGLSSSWSPVEAPPSDVPVGTRWDVEETSDLGVILDTLSEHHYGWCTRVLDAQFFGIPQRRERVFIVGCLGDTGARAAEVLLEPESVLWDLAACIQARQGAAGVSANGAGGGGLSSPAYTLRHNTNGSGASDNAWNTTDVPTDLPVFHRRGGFGYSQSNDVAPTLQHEGGSHTGHPMGLPPVAGPSTGAVANSIQASAGHHGHSSPRGDGADNLVVATFDKRNVTSGANRTRVEPGLPSTALHGKALTVAFHITQDPIDAEVSPAVGVGNERGCSTIAVMVPDAVAVSENQRAEVRETACSRQLSTGGGKPGQGYPAIRQAMSVRRLMPVECERLMGWPRVTQSVTIHVCPTAPSCENPENAAPAVTRCLRSPSSVSTVAVDASPDHVPFAVRHSSTHLAGSEKPVVLHVDFDLEGSGTVSVSTGGKPSSVVSADRRASLSGALSGVSFVQLGALLSVALERATSAGRAASPRYTTPSTHRLSGSRCVVVSGREIAERASDATTASRAARELLTSTTSGAGQSSQSFDSTLTTLCCSVMAAIAGFIPEPIRSTSSYDVELTISSGWTRFRADGSELADGARYRLIGNGVCAPVAAYIGRRLRQVHDRMNP